MKLHKYEVLTDAGKYKTHLSDEGVEKLRRLYHGFVSITRLDNLDFKAIAKELGAQK